jgi:hypothetical protein
VSSDAVDIGLLAAVCEDGLIRYRRIPVSGLKAEYNKRSVYPVEFITEKSLLAAMDCLPHGKVFRCSSGRIWGIFRDNGF